MNTQKYRRCTQEANVRVKVKWNEKEMRAAGGEDECTFDRSPLPDNKHPLCSSIPPSLPSSPLRRCTHHPFSVYGWVVIFPWDSGGGELSRIRCFIIPNKSREHVQTTSARAQWWNTQTETFFHPPSVYVFVPDIIYIFLIAVPLCFVCCLLLEQFNLCFIHRWSCPLQACNLAINE